VLAATIAASLLASGPIPALAAPSHEQTAADRQRVDRAVSELEAARQESARLDAEVAKASAELDRILADQQQARERLGSRAEAMYRSGDVSFLSVLLDAESFTDFASRWDLLMWMNRQDAEDLETLERARKDTQEAADSLMALQAEQARAVDEATQRVAQARADLAASEAALAAYEARIAEQSASSAASTPGLTQSASTPQVSGSGAWQTGVASHYGRWFTGRGASGAEIGPYTMMVAHKTLPFGTLVEFEYNGKRAVASVQDRGPFTAGRMWDLGPGVVRALGFNGVHEVRYRVID
jgi:rare lipoprotein A (peptidoglycan hydrolase)